MRQAPLHLGDLMDSSDLSWNQHPVRDAEADETFLCVCVYETLITDCALLG